MLDVTGSSGVVHLYLNSTEVLSLSPAAAEWLGRNAPASARRPRLIQKPSSNRTTERKVGLVFASLILKGRRRELSGTGLPLDRRCRHEAVHVVVALSLGHRVRSADVSEVRDRGGHVDIDYDSAEQTPQDRHFDDMTVNLGPHTDEVAREIYDFGSVNDVGSALFHALSIIAINRSPTSYSGPLTIDGLVTAARDRARLIVGNNAGAITQITDLMTARRRITAADIEQAWQSVIVGKSVR